jgi:integrase
MDQLNAPIKARQDRLGHTDSRTTLGRYTHVLSEDDRRIALQIGSVLWHSVAKPELTETQDIPA